MRSATDRDGLWVSAVDRRHADHLAVLGVIRQLRGRVLPVRVELLAKGAPRRVEVDEHEVVLGEEVVERLGRQWVRVVHASLGLSMNTAPHRDPLLVVVDNHLVKPRDCIRRAVSAEPEVADVAREISEALAHVVLQVDARHGARHLEQAHVEIDAQPVLLVLIHDDRRARLHHRVRLEVRVEQHGHEGERHEREEAPARAVDLQLLRHFAA